MTRNRLLFISTLFFTFQFTPFLHAQEVGPVQWTFTITPKTASVNLFTAQAIIAPGWHLYSQHVSDEGPLPTYFVFDLSSDYARMGTMIERGKKRTAYDSSYATNVTWYTENVSFSQQIKIYHPAELRGRVEYLACNRQQCVPGKKEFMVLIHP